MTKNVSLKKPYKHNNEVTSNMVSFGNSPDKQNGGLNYRDLSNFFTLIDSALEVIKKGDRNQSQYQRVASEINAAISCYRKLYVNLAKRNWSQATATDCDSVTDPPPGGGLIKIGPASCVRAVKKLKESVNGDVRIVDAASASNLSS